MRTDFATGTLSLIVCVWKLNGFRAGGGPLLLLGNVGVVADAGIGEPIEPNRGKVSVFGERALGLNVRVELTVCGMPLTPRPSGSSGIGVGGVGVRGGAGMGSCEAMIAIVVSWEKGSVGIASKGRFPSLLTWRLSLPLGCGTTR